MDYIEILLAKSFDKFSNIIGEFIDDKINIHQIKYSLENGYICIKYKHFKHCFSKHTLVPFIECTNNKLTKDNLFASIAGNKNIVKQLFEYPGEKDIMLLMLNIINTNFKYQVSERLYKASIMGMDPYYALICKPGKASVRSKDPTIRVIVKPNEYIKTKGTFQIDELIKVNNHLNCSSIKDKLTVDDNRDTIYIKDGDQKLCIIDKSTKKISFRTRLSISTFKNIVNNYLKKRLD